MEAAAALAGGASPASAGTSALAKLLAWHRGGVWQAAEAAGQQPGLLHQADWLASLLTGAHKLRGVSPYGCLAVRLSQEFASARSSAASRVTVCVTELRSPFAYVARAHVQGRAAQQTVTARSGSNWVKQLTPSIKYFACAGARSTTDWNNALKLGFDPQQLAFPPALLDQPWSHLLPRAVLQPGARVAPLQAGVAQRTGLPASCEVVAGTTDSVAAFLASGAQVRGHTCSVLAAHEDDSLSLTLLQESYVPCWRAT